MANQAQDLRYILDMESPCFMRAAPQWRVEIFLPMPLGNVAQEGVSQEGSSQYKHHSKVLNFNLDANNSHSKPMDTESTRSYPLCHDCDSAKKNDKKTPHSYDRKSWWSKACETWIFEFAGLIVGFLCLAATLSLLGVYNRKTVPDWPVTLNFALSLIGNIGFAATIFGVHGAVAQYKWILYSGDPRPLSQLGIFQRVRSSAFGPLELLYELGNHLILVAGGLAIILGMFWGPFTQNLIRYEIGPVISTDVVALLARNVHYRAHGQVTRGGRLDVDPMLQLNMLNSLAAAPNLDVNVPDYVCPTGNCTWPPAATQAFCSRCTDLTSQIVLDCKERDHKGVSIQTCLAKIPSSGCSLLSNSLWDADESFLNITQLDPETLRYHAIQRVSGDMIGQPGINTIAPSKPFVYTRPFVTKADYTATECWLRPCVRSFEASVINGIYKEAVLRTFMKDLEQWWGMPIQPKGEAADGIYAIRNHVNLTMFSMLPGLNIAGSVEIESYNRLFSSFVGSVKTADRDSALSFRGSEPGSTEYSERRTVASSMLKMMFNNTFSASDCGSPNDDTFACVVDVLAQALTRTLRNSGMREHGNSAVSEEDAVKGTVYTTATFVRAQWYWIGLPVAVWLLGMFTSVVIVLRSRAMKLPTWKDDLLPLVFLYNRERGLREEETRNGPHECDTKHQHSPVDLARGPLPRSLVETGYPEYDRLLRAHRQSSWAYQVAADKIAVQLRHYGGENVEEGVEAPVIRLQPVSKA